jgi:hypothetical protein
MSRSSMLCAVVVAAMNLILDAQGGQSVSVSIQPAAAVEVILFAAGADGKVLTTTDKNGKGSFDSSGLANLGNLIINEEICKNGRRVLLVASSAKARQNRDCRTTQIGTFVAGKDVVLNARLSRSFTPAIEATPIPEPTAAPPPPQPAATQQAGTKPAPPSTGVVFRDDFTKPTLDAAWKIDLEDKDRWALGEGELVIVTQPRVKAATAGGEQGVRNRFVLDRDLPANYTITARLGIAIVRDGTVVALRVRTPDGNYVVLGYGGYVYNAGYRRAFLGKMLSGKYGVLNSGQFWNAGKPTQINLNGFAKGPDVLWLRLEKKGFSFVGSFSFDGTLFETLGEQTLLRFDGSRLDLVAHDESQGVETAARFDYVEVIR